MEALRETPPPLNDTEPQKRLNLAPDESPSLGSQEARFGLIPEDEGTSLSKIRRKRRYEFHRTQLQVTVSFFHTSCD